MSEAFIRCFGRAPEAIARAPGRVNLLGEHTDYNDGFVLPVALALETEIELAARDDGAIDVVSEPLDARETLRVGAPERRGNWTDYVAGTTRMLVRHGCGIPGFDAYIRSTVPLGAGLSSSAALQVALLRVLRGRFALELDDMTIARLARDSEVEHVGAPVGLLDPLACSFGDAHGALHIDMRSLVMQRVVLPAELELVVVDSGISHAHATGGYRERRDECERAAQLLGVKSLRDATLASAERLPEPLAARVRHVVTENERVAAGVQALQREDLPGLGALLFASHASLRDDFCVSVPAIDAIVERAREIPAVLGARITGGGFGGAVVVCVRRGEAGRVGELLALDPARVVSPRSGT